MLAAVLQAPENDRKCIRSPQRTRVWTELGEETVQLRLSSTRRNMDQGHRAGSCEDTDGLEVDWRIAFMRWLKPNLCPFCELSVFFQLFLFFFMMRRINGVISIRLVSRWFAFTQLKNVTILISWYYLVANMNWQLKSSRSIDFFQHFSVDFLLPLDSQDLWRAQMASRSYPAKAKHRDGQP